MTYRARCVGKRAAMERRRGPESAAPLYTLQGTKVVPVRWLHRWDKAMRRRKKRPGDPWCPVKVTVLGPRLKVTTIFLGFDDSAGLARHPHVFETAVIDGRNVDVQGTDTTYRKALKRHAHVIDVVKTAAAIAKVAAHERGGLASALMTLPAFQEAVTNAAG